jgi:hypothetical protein
MSADFAGYRPVMFCFSPLKVGPNGTHHAASDSAFTSKGNPALPSSSDEVEIGRWELTSGDPKQPCAIVDMLLDAQGRGPGNPEHGELTLATVFAGDARCLVTNKALRFTGYAGSILNFGKAGPQAVLAFTVPLSAIARVDAGQSNAFYTGKPLNIHLGEWGSVVAVVKAAKANDKFRSGVFATSKNKEFAAQIESARGRIDSHAGVQS